MLDKIFPKLLLLTFTGASIGTSTMAGLKVASQWNTDSIKENSAISIDVSAAPTSEPKADNVFPSPTVAKPKPTTPQLVNSSACVVTLFGQQFDVAPLMNNHQGGNIFVCNSDMTSVYQKQHGTDLSQMSQFRIGAASTTQSNLNLKLFSGDDDDKREEENEHEDENEDNN